MGHFLGHPVLTRVVFSVLSKRSSASLYSQRWPHSTATWFLVRHGSYHITNASPRKLRLHPDFSFSDSARLLWTAEVIYDSIYVLGYTCSFLSKRNLSPSLSVHSLFQPVEWQGDDLILNDGLKPGEQSSCSGPSIQSRECRVGWTEKGQFKHSKRAIWNISKRVISTFFNKGELGRKELVLSLGN